MFPAQYLLVQILTEEASINTMPTTQTYRAAVARSFGPPDVLGIEDLPGAPLPAGTIRVAVRVGGVNPVDAAIRSGSFGGATPFVPGTEFAGVVTEVSAGTTGVAVGAEVVGFGTPPRTRTWACPPRIAW
jgi:enoyl reductase